MRPVLLDIWGITFPSYYTMLTVGFMVCTWLTLREIKRVGLNADDFLDMSLYMLIAGLLGARLLHVFADGYFWDYVHLCTDPLLVDVPSFIHVPCAVDADCLSADAGALCHPDTGRCHPARDCLAPLKFWHGGLAFLGGFLGAVGVAVLFMRKRKMPFWQVADISGFGVALGLVFGRAGCLLSGCCFGAPSDGPLTLRFSGYVTRLGPNATCPPNYDLVSTPTGDVCAFGRPAFLDHVEHGHLALGSDLSLPVHATQIYEGAFCLLLFLWLYLWRRKRIAFPGQLFWEFCLYYSVGRFAVEFLRADDRGLWFGDLLSTSQLLGLPVMAAAIWYLWIRKRPPVAPAPPPAEPDPPDPAEAP